MKLKPIYNDSTNSIIYDYIVYMEQNDLPEFINIESLDLPHFIGKIQHQQKEIKSLNNIIKDIKSQLDYLETYSSKGDVFEDMKRRLDRIDKILSRIRN